jgi:hypothetical protein
MGKVTSHINSSEMLSSIDLIKQSRGVNADIASLSSQLAEITSVTVSLNHYPKLGGETNDSGRFTRAFNDLASQGGGIIQLPKGTFVANVKVPSNCGIIGQGRQTIIQSPTNSTSGAVELYDGNVSNIYLENFSIDGNKVNQLSSNAKGVYLNGNTTLPASSNPTMTNDARHIIKDIFIVNTKGIGFEIHGRGESQISGIQVMLSDDIGMVLDAFDNWYTNLSSGANKKTGIVLSQNNCRLVNCKSWNNGQGGTVGDVETYGFKITSVGIVEGVVITGCEAQANYNHGFAFINTRACVGSGLNSELNGLNGTLGIAGGSGFYFKDSRENNIQGVCRNMNTAVQEYAVTIDGYSINNRINVVAWFMKTGAFNDISNNKDNNTLDILNVTTGEVVSNYRNQSIDFLRVNGATNSLALSPFGVYANETKNIMGAYVQKECTTTTGMTEVMRFEAFQSGTPSNLSQIKLRTQINGGGVDISTKGTTISLNSNLIVNVKTGTSAPTINADFIGQTYVDYTNRVVYTSVNNGTGATDWKQTSN